MTEVSLDDEVERGSRDKRTHKAKVPNRPPSAGAPVSAAIANVRAEEHATVADWLRSLGPGGAFQVRITRDEPKTWEGVNVGGFLETTEELIDEEWLRQRYGGGKYHLKVNSTSDTGRTGYLGHRTLIVAGAPKVQGVTPQPQATSAATDAVLGVVREMASKRDEISQPTQLLLDQMQRTLDQQSAELMHLRAAAATPVSTSDPVRDKIMDRLLDGQSTQVAALTQQHASEIRMLKEQAAETERKLREQFDRDRDRDHDRHQGVLDTLRQSFEREIATMRSSHEATIQAIRMSSETGTKAAESTARIHEDILRSENVRLTAEVAALKAEVESLRAKKELSIIDKVKEIETIRESVGAGNGEQSALDKLVETVSPMVPGILEMIAARSAGGAPAPPPTATVQAVGRPMRRMVVDNDGQTFIEMTAADGSVRVVPAAKKKKVVTTDAGAQVEAPDIDKESMRKVIAVLEAAFSNGQEPEVVATTTKSFIPDEVLRWMRDHDTEQTSGVDLLLSKVADLPSTSVLANLKGRMWLRQVGKALIGS